MNTIIIELLVNNHPGVMYQISGLFARRAYNLEGILCGKIGDGSISRMYLMVGNDQNVDQITKQLEKLIDVVGVSARDDLRKDEINRFYDFF